MLDKPAAGLAAATKTIGGAIFVIYWLTTIAYVSPNNYIKAKLARPFALLQPFLFQRWEFFAPPPTFNLTVYAIAEVQNPADTIMLDLTSEIRRQKISHAPFNTAEDAIDYVLSNASDIIMDQEQAYIAQAKKAKPEANETVWLNDALSKIRENEPNNPCIVALRNYASVAVRKFIPPSRVKNIRVSITTNDLPKFGDVMTGARRPAKGEITVYVSQEFPLSR